MLMRSILGILIVGLFQNVSAQEPISWGPDMHFSTFSIVILRGIQKNKVTHDEVLENADKSKKIFRELLKDKVFK